MAYEADYVTDPSNTDQASERVRIRTWLQQPEQSELQQHLARLASLSGVLSMRLAEACNKWCAEHIVFTLRLRAYINRAAFSELDRASKNYILRHCLAIVGGQPYPVPDDKLNRIQLRVAAGGRSTSGGCVVQANAECIMIVAEFGRRPEPELTVQAGRVYRFDKRWLVTSAQDGVVRRLGSAAWARRSRLSGFPPLSGWTARMGAMIPVLHGLDGRLYCPHFKDYSAIYSAASPVFGDFERAATGILSVAVLPVDGPVE